MTVPHINPVTIWTCPNCPVQARTTKGETNRFHYCAAMKGLTTPMVPQGTRCAIVAREREDYVGREMVTTNDEGRPIMAIETIRADGNDVVVFAPCATTRAEGQNTR